MKTVLKRVLGCMTFLALLALSLHRTTDILTPKAENRYYMLEKYLKENDKFYDIQVFGSCHSYTSFNPLKLEEVTGVSGFVYGNAGEIIPTTYVRMCEQFKKHTPKVAFVEIWGINPYETYSTQERVFGFYFQNNVERLPFSIEKCEVIADFETLTMGKMSFPIASYKDRLLDESLCKVDFNYSLAALEAYSSEYVYEEMTSRLMMNGFKCNPSKDISNYPEKQTVIEAGEMVEIEPDIVKYICKIIDLCAEKDVKLVFYRSPYLSTANELKKLNHLRSICSESGVDFVDLEPVIEWDYKVDFLDYEHLSETGANKATEYLSRFVTE